NELAASAFAHRCETERAIAHHHCGHAVLETGSCETIPAELGIVVGVYVDETGAQRVPVDIDLPGTCAGKSTARAHLSIPYRDVAIEGSCPGPIHDLCITNCKVCLTHGLAPVSGPPADLSVVQRLPYV